MEGEGGDECNVPWHQSNKKHEILLEATGGLPELALYCVSGNLYCLPYSRTERNCEYLISLSNHHAIIFKGKACFFNTSSRFKGVAAIKK